MKPGDRHRVARCMRRRMLLTLLLTLAVPLGNSLVLRPSVNWFVALSSDADTRPPLLLQPMEPQHSLFVAKESELRLAEPTRSAAVSQFAGPPQTSLRPFRLAIDWSLLWERIAALSLLRMEVRLQI